MSPCCDLDKDSKLRLMIMHHPIEFDDERFGGLEDMIWTNSHWHFEPSLWPWPWTQKSFFFIRHSGLWWCIIGQSLVAKESAVQSSSEDTVERIVFFILEALAVTLILKITDKLSGDVAQSVERRAGTPLHRFDSPVRQGIFLLASTFNADSLTVSVHPRVQSHALTCEHTKDPVVRVRVRGTMETLKPPACTVVCVAPLCRSRLSQGGSKPNFPWEKS